MTALNNYVILDGELKRLTNYLKSEADKEMFSGMSALSAKHGFYTGIFSMNICAAISFSIEQKVREQKKK